MSEPSSSTSQTNVAEFSVSELSAAIKHTIEDSFGYVRLRGEISGYRGPHSSGHCYFALKDERAKIEAVIWRGVFGRLRIKPEEGMEVIAQGRVTTYPNSSKYQIVIEALEPAGITSEIVGTGTNNSEALTIISQSLLANPNITCVVGLGTSKIIVSMVVRSRFPLRT